jgi:hypothetical protein
MAKLEIWDLHERGYLAFDLRDLMRLLAPRSLAALWTVVCPENSEVEALEATGEGGVELERLAKKGAQITGTELAAIAERTNQVIWGEFVGSLPSNEQWIVIRAFDSTFYEIITADDAVLDTLQATFRDIRLPKPDNS